MGKLTKILNNLNQIFEKEDILVDEASLETYSYDATPFAKGVKPIAVVFPKNPYQVQELVKFAQKEEIPLFPRGSGSGLTGGAIPITKGIVVSFEKMNKIHYIDDEELVALVDPGVITYDFQKELEKKGLMYPPDPSSYKYSSIGGNIAENAGGPRCVKYGVTKDYVLDLECVFPDGTLTNVGSKTIKWVSGYNLKDIIVGSEGTLALITKAYLKLLPLPESRETALFAFSNVEDAARTVFEIFKNRVIPSALEFLDEPSLVAIKNYVNLPYLENEKIKTILIVETDGYKESALKDMQRCISVAKLNNSTEIIFAQNEKEKELIWQARRSLSPAIMKLKPYKVNEDIVVPRKKLVETLKGVYEIAKEFNLLVVCFGHAGDGNIHVNFLYDKGEEERVEKAVDKLFKFVIKLGGAISGEHGIGIAKAKYLPLEVKDAYYKMKAIKQTLDPKNILNPGKIFVT